MIAVKLKKIKPINLWVTKRGAVRPIIINIWQQTPQDP